MLPYNKACSLHCLTCTGSAVNATAKNSLPVADRLKAQEQTFNHILLPVIILVKPVWALVTETGSNFICHHRKGGPWQIVAAGRIKRAFTSFLMLLRL
jgi:hypothetical protein